MEFVRGRLVVEVAARLRLAHRGRLRFRCTREDEEVLPIEMDVKRQRST